MIRFEGAHDFRADRQTVWSALFDTDRLRRALPGCERLDAIGGDAWTARMRVGIGTGPGILEGTVRIGDKVAAESYRMALDASGNLGSVRGTALVTLVETAGVTRLAYTADVEVGGFIAGVGQRMLGGVSKMMAHQFFSKMSKLVQAPR